jgi:hypothetical protein
MQLWLILGVSSAVLAAVTAVDAAPSAEIRGAAARVQVIPESRADIQVTLVHADSRLPIRVLRLGDKIFIMGDVAHRIRGCVGPGGRPGVAVFGRGAIAYDQLPQLVIRMPAAVRLVAGEAVFGVIGRSASVDFTNQGCGDWTLADVAGRLRLNQAGAGAARAGAAGSSDLSVVGAGGISVGQIRSGLTAVSSGAGDITVAGVHGRLDARVGGSGDIDLASGSVGDMSVSIAGSGAVRFRGTARTLRVSIAGSGDVSVATVTGQVTRQVFGAGRVLIGPLAVPAGPSLRPAR